MVRDVVGGGRTAVSEMKKVLAQAWMPSNRG